MVDHSYVDVFETRQYEHVGKQKNSQETLRDERKYLEQYLTPVKVAGFGPL